MSPTTVTGSPKAAFAQAAYIALAADVPLLALVTDVMTALPRDRRTAKPYVVVGRREMRNIDAGAMQREGGRVTLFIDAWSDKTDTAEIEAIQARIHAVLTRNDIAVQGFTLYNGSVTIEDELVFPEPDADLPEASLFHGVQQVSGLLEEAL